MSVAKRNVEENGYRVCIMEDSEQMQIVYAPETDLEKILNELSEALNNRESSNFEDGKLTFNLSSEQLKELGFANETINEDELDDLVEAIYQNTRHPN